MGISVSHINKSYKKVNALQDISFVDSTGTAITFATRPFAIAQAVALG